MAKLLKKVQKLINANVANGRLSKTLVQYHVTDITEQQAKEKGIIFHQTWLGYFVKQHDLAVEENQTRELSDFIESHKDD